MSNDPADRRVGWQPSPRPEWARRVIEEGYCMDIQGVVPLDENSLIETAKRNTGLDDFGDDDWREPFQVLIKSLEEESGLHLIGRLMARSDILMHLEGRLWIEDTYKKHPEIDEQQIVKPLLIMGQGRSGTTGLHNMLSNDPVNRSPMTWEALFPYPPPETATYHTDPRILKAKNRFEIWNRVTPEIIPMHDIAGDLATEPIHLHCMCFQSPLWFNLYGIVPTYTAYIGKRGSVKAYEYEKRILKYLQWKCPGDRWVHKTPGYTDTWPDVLKVFPDAQFIWIHRDPIKALASAVSINGTIFWSRSDRTFTSTEVKDQYGDLEAMVSAPASAARFNRAIDWIEQGVVSKAQLCNVQYADFIKDPVGTARKIYDYFSIKVPESSFVTMQKHIDDRMSMRKSRDSYQYEVGSKEQIARERELYRRYQTYFSIPDEI